MPVALILVYNDDKYGAAEWSAAGQKGMAALLTGYAQLILAMLLWGSGSVLTRIADQPAPVIMFVRGLTACGTIGLFILWTRRSLNLSGSWLWCLASGACLASSSLFFFLAVQTTAIGTAVLACNTGPIFYITWVCLFLGEKLERRTLFALPMAMAGILLLVSGSEISLSSRDFVGILYGLVSGLSYSFVVLIAKGVPRIPTTSLILVQAAVATVMFAPATLSLPAIPGGLSLAAMICMGAVHSCLCLGLYFNALKAVKVQHAGILGYLDPASAIVYAYLCFGEVPPLTTVLGGLCILAAGALTLRGGNTAAEKTTAADA